MSLWCGHIQIDTKMKPFSVLIIWYTTFEYLQQKAQLPFLMCYISFHLCHSDAEHFKPKNWVYSTGHSAEL